MNTEEIQIQFPRPGKWEEFTLTAIHRDKGKYTRIDRYTAAEIPDEQAPAMQAVVAALVGLAAPWQAAQVWARLGNVVVCDETDIPVAQMDDAVELAVEAIHAGTKGRRIFTDRDYPDFIITDPAAVAFFKFFTRP